MKTVLITGANRGLGLEFAKQYLAEGWRILATCRRPDDASELSDLADRSEGRLEIYELDVTDTDRIAALSGELADEAIDVLLNNAGVYPDKGMSLGSLDEEAWLHAFRVNTIAPVKMSHAFLSHVERSDEKKIIIVTSKMGSVDDNTSGGSYLYRTSKAAVNMAAKSLAVDLTDRVTVALLHPGWVQTDMGGAQAPIAPEDSVSGMRQVIADLQSEDSGHFFAYTGEEVAW